MKYNIDNKFSRRKVLKTTAASIGVGGIPAEIISSDKAKSRGYLLNRPVIAEAHIYYNIPSDQPLGHADGRRRFAKNKSKSQIGIIDDSYVFTPRTISPLSRKLLLT
jgi:hypothetical protein